MAGNNMEMKAHVGSYARFLSLLKIGTIASALVAAVVVLLIAN